MINESLVLTSMLGDSHCMLSMLRQARLFVHFHSFSCVATSSMTRGTQPPKTNMRWLINVAECRDLKKTNNYKVKKNNSSMFQTTNIIS